MLEQTSNDDRDTYESLQKKVAIFQKAKESLVRKNQNQVSKLTRQLEKLKKECELKGT